ncbi:MAG: cadmium-translocating P-type ATPase [Ruminococcaceae bacterium]|nr:cadmium-translocating P-type ATPase [Oscillospiraceae bacterium]
MREHREDIIKLGLGALLLAVACIIKYTVQMPWWGYALIFALPYLTVGGEVLLGAVKNILKGEIFDECFLMSIATVGAFCIGEYAEAVFVMLFFGIGELFEHIAEDRSRKSITSLMELRPDFAAVEKENGIVITECEKVCVGDIIVVKAGERIPLDGIIVSGESSLDAAAITGEAVPLAVGCGDSVSNGCINLSGVLKIRVSSVFAESTVAKILDLVQNANQNKAKSESFIRRFSKIYTPVVVVSAFLLAVIPLFFGINFIERALMFLVVSCPCALVVSVPLTFFSGIGGAAKNGILIKSAGALEMLSHIKNVVFDKTGTLTEGSLSVCKINACGVEEEYLLYIAAACEWYSSHPVGVALKKAYKKQISKEIVTDTAEFAGKGVSAKVLGDFVLAGNYGWLRENGVEVEKIDTVETAVYVSQNGRYIGCIEVCDSIKADSKATIDALNSKNIDVFMLTGDNATSAKNTAEKLGINKVYSELLPAGKAEIIGKIMKNTPKKKTLFAGDGINDAPVLATAEIGVAMGALGTDAAIEAADIVLMEDKVSKILTAIKISDKTCRIVRQNIVFSIAFKLAVMVLAAFGLPFMWWLAGFADAGVLVITVLNSARAQISKS